MPIISHPTPSPLLSIGCRAEVDARVAFYRGYDSFAPTGAPIGPLLRMMDRIGFAAPKQVYIVGATRRFLGRVEVAQQVATEYGYEYEPGCLFVKESIFVYQVREKLMRKMFEVLPRDVRIL